MLDSVIKYILQNSPVSHSSLEERAVTKHQMTLADFDSLMAKAVKDPRISSSVKGDDVWYKTRSVRPKSENAVDRFIRWQKENPYPREELGESPFKICFCAMWRGDDGEIYNAEIHGHRKDCDAVVYPAQYKLQYAEKRLLL